jgi:hypothetical protein
MFFQQETPCFHKFGLCSLLREVVVWGIWVERKIRIFMPSSGQRLRRLIFNHLVPYECLHWYHMLKHIEHLPFIAAN